MNKKDPKVNLFIKLTPWKSKKHLSAKLKQKWQGTHN